MPLLEREAGLRMQPAIKAASSHHREPYALEGWILEI